MAADRGVVGAAERLLVKTISIVGLAIGIGRRTPPAEEYPLDSISIVQDGGVYTDWESVDC